MIEIRDLDISFKNEVVYDAFSLSIAQGEKVAIAGESGRGKTTLLKLLAGFIPHFKGDVTIDGLALNAQNISEIRKKTAWLPQEVFLNMKAVEELFYAPFLFDQNKTKYPKEEAVLALFDAFDLSPHLLTKQNKEISGGQKQRLLLSSCLLLEKPLLLLDEPTSALDKQIKKKVADYILSLPNVTVLAVTHDEYWMSRSSRILHL